MNSATYNRSRFFERIQRSLVVRTVALIALISILGVRFADTLSHQHTHAESVTWTTTILLDDEARNRTCTRGAVHEAAHCASHMSEHLQPSPMIADVALAWSVPKNPYTHDAVSRGRVLPPPIRPPSA